MLKCPFCNHQNNDEKALYCVNCGAHIVDELERISLSDRLKLWGGELRILSVLFINFTGLEKLIDKQTDSDVMINLHECMIEVEAIIKKLKGTVEQIVPDNRILGIFGAPKAQRDDPLRVVRCAWQIKNWWLEKKKQSELLQDVDLTIGINTGRAFFGYIVEEFSFLTVIGDTINTAARLSEICPPNEILMSENTYNRVLEHVDVEHMGERSVKGKTAKVSVYLINNLKDEALITAPQKIPLFGRDAELDKLISIVQKIKDNKIKFCIISGQMGIGKTRLKEEFEKYLSANESFNFIETHCSVEVQSPYYAFKFLLRRYFQINEFDSEKEIIHRLNDGINKRGLTPLNARGLRHLFLTDLRRLKLDEMLSFNEEIYTAIKNIIKYECRKQPLVLIFEEFHRADEMSKYLIAYLTSELKNEPVLFLMVNVSKDFITNIDAPIEEINLTSLSQENISDLVGFILKDTDERLTEFFYKSAGGNPLFTIEAIRNTRRTNLIKKVDGRWTLEKEQRLSFLDDLYGVVMSTIDSLPSTYRLVIDYASVIGYSFSYRILKGLLEAANLKKELDYLITEGYIILSKNDKDPVYVFRHNLLKDAAYTVLPLRKRKEIHHQVAVLFEEQYADQLSNFYENIGHHYLSSEHYTNASHYFKLAGDKAKNLYALDQALYFYNMVLKILKNQPDQVSSDVMRNAFLSLTDLYEITGDVQKMLKYAEQGLESARSERNLEDEINFLERNAYALYLQNKFDKAEELLLAGIDQCGEKKVDTLSILYADLGLLYQTKFEYEKSILNYNLSWNNARTKGNEKGEILCLYNLSKLHKSLGNYEQALEYLDYGLNELVSAENIRWFIQFRYLIAEINYQIWNLDKAKNNLLECLKISDDISNVEIYVKSALHLALINTANRNLKKAKEYVQFADRKVSFLIRENLLAEINLKKAIIYNGGNNNQKALDFITSALKIAHKFNQREVEFHCYNYLAVLKPKASFEYARKALDIAEMIKLQPLIADALFRMTQIFTKENDMEKARYYGRKALLVYDDLKFKLDEKNRNFFNSRPEYVSLLEL
jgi:class 3 adenylate cyclase/tetratricopeptide (TPR) repeat protein